MKIKIKGFPESLRVWVFIVWVFKILSFQKFISCFVPECSKVNDWPKSTFHPYIFHFPILQPPQKCSMSHKSVSENHVRVQ